MPIHIFLGLAELLPHQELRQRNMLVQRDESMGTVIFVSHQWTSFDHPDHTGRQLRTLQRMLQRMRTGQVPDVDAPFSDKMSLTGSVKIAPGEWKGILKNAFIWIDYAGVPQKEKANTNDAASGSDGRCAITQVCLSAFERSDRRRDSIPYPRLLPLPGSVQHRMT